MQTNRFLPPPVRLSQALDSELPSASGQQVTRRSFMKRTGGATVATLVAWNLATKMVEAKSNYLSDGSNTSDWRKHILICIGEPSQTEYNAAVKSSPPPDYAEGDQQWRKLPHIDISSNVLDVRGTATEPEFERLLDNYGNGYSFHLVHWLAGGELVRTGDFVAACLPGGRLVSRLVARAAIIIGRWTYKGEWVAVGGTPYSGVAWVWGRDKFVYSTVCKAPDLAISATVEASGHCPNEKARVWDREAMTAWIPVDVDGKRLGWLNLSQSVIGSPDELSVSQRYMSVATFLPRAILTNVSNEYSSSVNVSVALQGKLKDGDAERSAGLTVGWQTADKVISSLEIKSPPSMIAHHLDWRHIIAMTDLGIQCNSDGNSYPTIPESRDWLP